MVAIPLVQTVTVNVGQRQAFYVTMSSNDTYVEYGRNYTGDNTNTMVVQDPNLAVYAGTGNRYPFGDYLSPRFFVGKVAYFIEP